VSVCAVLAGTLASFFLFPEAFLVGVGIDQLVICVDEILIVVDACGFSFLKEKKRVFQVPAGIVFGAK
jgi:hypothetical protein